MTSFSAGDANPVLWLRLGNRRATSCVLSINSQRQPLGSSSAILFPERILRYLCSSFGWYQEFLAQIQVSDWAAAESALLRSLDEGAMIVHICPESNPDTPEMIGRHRQLQAFTRNQPTLHHEVERFLLDPAAANSWQQAAADNQLLDDRWSVIDFWSAVEEQGTNSCYGRAMLTSIQQDQR